MTISTDKIIHTDADGNACVTHPAPQFFEANMRDYVPAVPAQPEVPEIRDPETDEITQKFQPAVDAVPEVLAVTEEDCWAMITNRLAETNDLPIEAFKRVPNSVILKDRTFRNAWKISGSKLGVDLPKAQEIAKDHIRTARKPVLERLDVEVMIAEERGQTADVKSARDKKQVLRDATADPRLSTYDVGELKENMTAILNEIKAI